MKIIIIGAGPGGYETAVLAAKEGNEVVIIEENKAGGTCLNVGCIPTKSFCKNADLIEELKEAEVFGLKDLNYTFDFSKVIERKNEVVNTLVSGVEMLLKHKNITFIRGKAKLLNNTTIEVNGEAIVGDNIIIATGSSPKLLPIEGLNLSNVITSKEILDINHVPEKLCIVGGGVIGLEFASIFHRFGSQVTVVEFAKTILPNFDTDICKRLKQTLVKKGIEIINQAAVSKIEQQADSLVVNYTLKGKEESIIAETVLMAVGRVANIDSLNLDDLSIAYDKGGIKVNEYMQTSVPSIYAIGDINGLCMLAHAASFQGIKALNHIMGKEDSIQLDIVPSAVFTSPEVATVGLTDKQCKERGLKVKAKKAFFRANGKSLSMGETEGLCKLIINEEQQIIGCHVFGPHAADLIHEMSALIKLKTSLTSFKEMIHAHPTLSEVWQEAAKEF